MADADKKFEQARSNVFELASFVDSQLRVMSRLYSWSDEEMEYLKNWVYKEKDPFFNINTKEDLEKAYKMIEND